LLAISIALSIFSSLAAPGISARTPPRISCKSDMR
jgi:hypothetical protein